MNDRNTAAPQEWLRRETDVWAREGLIRPDQARLILARYGLAGAETTRSLRQVPLIRMLTVLGALVAGVGVLLMVGANWESIPKMARLLLILIASSASYAAGWRWREDGEHFALGEAFILLGSLVWGSGIFLVGQMYQGTGSGGGERMGLLYWLAGAVPLALILRSPIQMALSLVLACAWWLWAWGDTMEGFGGRAPVYAMFFVAFALGLALFAKGRLLSGWERFRAFAPVCQGFGIALCTAGAYLLTFGVGWWHDRSMEWWHHPLLLVPLAAAAVLGAFSGWRDRGHAGASATAWTVAAIAVLTAGLAWGAASGAFELETSTRYTIPVLAIVFNIVLLAMEAGFLWLGVESGSVGLVNWGMAVFFIHLVTRYFDLFARMLPTGMAFVGAGVLLILGGTLLDRQRKRLLGSMEAHA